MRAYALDDVVAITMKQLVFVPPPPPRETEVVASAGFYTVVNILRANCQREDALARARAGARRRVVR